ncbi:hypothetical protein Q8F55_005502 [Vanrija albida]|uniref:EamA domain-containing protein n=1 Tax=Vanrija albida TaxID=181172 RepID=A0ABR3Q1U1_9TREE
MASPRNGDDSRSASPVATPLISRRRSSAARRPRSDSTLSRAFDGSDLSPTGTFAVKPLVENRDTFAEDEEDDDDDGDDDDDADEVLPLHSNGFVDLHLVGGSKERGIRAYLHPTILQLYDHNYGLFLIAMAQFFFASMSTSVKFLMETTAMSTLALIFVRMGITLIFCWIVLFARGDPHPILGPPAVRKVLVLRGMAGFGGLVCAYQALRALSVSDAVTIGFLTPSFTALFGFLLLGESFGLKEAISGFASLLGVILISRPPFIFGHGWGSQPVDDTTRKGRLNIDLPNGEADDSSRLVAVTWALGGVLFSATAYLTIRYIGKRANALHSIGYFSMACTFTCGIAMLLFPSNQQWPSDTYGFALILLIGVFGFCAQCLLTFGLQHEKAGRAGLAMYLQIFFAVILDLVVFGTIPSFLSFVGTIIILSSAVWVAMSSLKTAPPALDVDEETPLSRSPSPQPVGSKTVRGQLYSYTSVPTSDTPSSSATLHVPSPQPRPPRKDEIGNSCGL